MRCEDPFWRGVGVGSAKYYWLLFQYLLPATFSIFLVFLEDEAIWTRLITIHWNITYSTFNFPLLFFWHDNYVFNALDYYYLS